MGKIAVNNLGKAYKQYDSRWSRLVEWLDPRGKQRARSHWVLQDVSFSINPGEAVGIVGINGSGKSTLLKMIVGTVLPSSGSVVSTGRIAALLELGMGFHPDFTGRQNVYMAGHLLGLNSVEVTALMPEIEDFAEIGDYIDQPVRVYSSGMQVRLAFSVATAVRPDILIVDEALSVGDAYFQHKSFDRISQFRQQGTTLLIVSHDKNAILSICDRVILLNAGRVVMDREPETVLDYYNAMLAGHQDQKVRQQELKDGKVQTVSGTGEAVVEDVALLNEQGERVEVIGVGQSVQLQVVLRPLEAVPELVIGYMLKDRLGQPVFGTNTHHLKCSLENPEVGQSIICRFGFSANLGQGNYSVSIALHASHSHLVRNYEWRDLALVFEVVNLSQAQFLGMAWLPPIVSWVK